MKTTIVFLFAIVSLAASAAPKGNNIRGKLEESGGFFVVENPVLVIGKDKLDISSDEDSGQAVCTAFSSKSKLKGAFLSTYASDRGVAELTASNTDFSIKENRYEAYIKKVYCQR